MATWILKNYPDECREKQKRSTAKVIPLDNHTALLQQIIAEIGSHRCGIQKREPNIKTTEGRPRKYYFTKSSDFFEIDQIENQKTPIDPIKVVIRGTKNPCIPYFPNSYLLNLRFIASGSRNVALATLMVLGVINGSTQT